MIWLRKHWLRVLTHIGSLVPLSLLLWDFSQGQLTANPIQYITQSTGKAALVLLVLSLLCTPLNTLFRLRQVLPLRRPLGLYAFFYVCLHLLTFVWIDYGFDMGLIWLELSEKLYVIAGFSAFLLLLPLALTSTKGWMRRLGKRWKQLHRLVYLAAILAAIHYLWLVKSITTDPLFYAAAVTLLLILRIRQVRGWLSNLRRRLVGRLAVGRGDKVTGDKVTG